MNIPNALISLLVAGGQIGALNAFNFKKLNAPLNVNAHKENQTVNFNIINRNHVRSKHLSEKKCKVRVC
jgi:hypothetical protein